MPFDALVMRAVTCRLGKSIHGSRIRAVRQLTTRVYISLESKGALHHLEWVLEPRFRRIQQVRTVPRAARPAAWADRLSGARIELTEQPPWERVWHWALLLTDDLGRQSRATLVTEMAGHLTNMLWLDPEQRVGDAWRRIAPDREGRTIWPGYPYEAPPSVPDPCVTGEVGDLPPWARRYADAHPGSLRDLCDAYAQGIFHPFIGTGSDNLPDVWVLPWPGADVHAVDDWDRALDMVFAMRETTAQRENLRKMALSQIDREAQRIARRLEEAESRVSEGPSRWKTLADAVLTAAPAWAPGAHPATVMDLTSGQELAVPWEHPDQSWQALVETLYRRYKKDRATRTAMAQWIPRLQSQLRDLESHRQTVLAADTVAALQRAVAAEAPGQGPGNKADAKAPFRRFTSHSGYEIWIGRTQDENATLTFRHARPDDLWFHVKQYPGSHVLLRCGKRPVHPLDVQDCGELAVFYSRAGKGSMVPVDYTARKYVRKRPHAEPGQVLYTHERTVYVTPDEAHLERLGARREREAGPDH